MTVKEASLQWLDTSRVVPRLANFELVNTTISAEALLAMISSSKVSQTYMRLRRTELIGGSTWRDVLSAVTKENLYLTLFKLEILRQETGAKGSSAVDFRDAKEEVSGEYRLSLNLKEKHALNSEVTLLSYDGPNVGRVLDILASCVKSPNP